MTSKLLILGCGDTLEEATSIAQATRPNEFVEVLEINAPDRFNFMLPELAEYPPDRWHLFIAIDDRGLNMSRHQLVAAAKGLGYKLAKLVAQDAEVSASVVVGENSMICRGVIIHRNCKLGLNVLVRPWSRIGEGCKLGNGDYIDVGATLGRESELGDYVTVGAGATVEVGARIGRYCELRLPQTYRGPISDKTFYFDRFENPVCIIAPV